MAIRPKFFGTISNGQFVHHEPAQFQRHLQIFKEGQEMEITIAPKFKRRTSGQPGEETNFNGYYWAVIVRIIADEMGEWDQDYVHNLIQMEVGNFRVSKSGIKVPKGTSELSGSEFADYCRRARMWANVPGNVCERGLFLPEPNEVEY